MRPTTTGRRNVALSAAVLFGGLAYASPGQALVKTIVARGDWTLAAGVDEGGTQVCSAATTGTQIYMAVKIYANSPKITVHIAKTNWRIPSGSQTRVFMHFDQRSPWSGVAYATKHASLLETTIPLSSIKSFVGQFAGAHELVVAFPDGNERPWQISMRGSRYIMGRLADCVSLMAASQRPTQPFAPNAGPTQPFSNGPATQPTSPVPAPVPVEPKPPLPQGERI
ncbi:hypothetical protein [Methylopila sp. M107]|uniref:hypothetical protein n=1 Tax=Methylopila sp. M107 TaxID=1101190 RepID=UPI000377C0EE|nr:hypothetical protein [Methylopila sp. M107]